MQVPEPRRLNFGWLVLGVVVLAAGMLFLLHAAGAVDAGKGIDRFWPLAIVIAALGLLALAEIRSSIVLAVLLVTMGAVVVLFTTHLVEKSAWRYVWSGAVVVAGLVIVSRGYRRPTGGTAGKRVHFRALNIHSKLLLVRGAGKVGLVIEWLCTGGRPVVLMLAVGAVSLLWVDWWGVLLAYVILLLGWSATKAKTRIVIETFEDQTSSIIKPEEAGESGAAGNRFDPHRLDETGLGGLLATKLAEMRLVYQRLEEPLGRPRPGPAEGAVQLEDIGDVLRSAFTTQSNLSIGPVTLPFGSLMALVGRLVQAPHLRGAIYGGDMDLTLTARLTMQGRDYVWSVRPPVGEEAKPAQARAQMVAELAYRIFTDLSLRGQAEWPATRYWLDALKERQACQRTPRDRRYHLETAENHLRNALAEDERFYLAAYNLGIVYRQLAEEDAKRERVAEGDPRHLPADDLRGVRDEPYMRSALSVFAYAIEKLDRGRWEAYYGLALADWKLAERAVGDLERRLNRVIDHCDRALDLASGRAARAQIQDLKATAQLELGRQMALQELEKTPRRQRLDAAAKQHELRKATAKQELCNAALKTWSSAYRAILRELVLTQLWRVTGDGQHTVRLRKQAARCLLNLAIAYDAVKPDSVAKPSSNLIRQWQRHQAFGCIRALTAAAVRLADLDAEAHEKFARIADRWEEFDVAQNELQHAIRIDQNNATYWAMLAEVSAKRAREEDAKPQHKLTGRKSQETGKHARDAANAACRGAESAIDFGLLDVRPETGRETHETTAEIEDPKDAHELLENAYLQLKNQKAANAVRSRRKLRSKIARARKLDPYPAYRLLKDLRCRYQSHDYEAAIIERHLGHLLLRSSATIANGLLSDPHNRSANGRPKSEKVAEDELAREAETIFTDAIKRLERSDHKRDIRRWGLLGERARAIASQTDRTGEALPLAEDGVAIDPLSAGAWRALALVREHGGDYAGACTAWSRVQLIEPDDAGSRVALALCQWQYAGVADDAERHDLLCQALANVHGAREHYDIAQIDERRRAEWWAAKCHSRLGQFAEMPSHLRFILASLEQRTPKTEEKALQALVELKLAQSYRQTRHFADAEEYALRAKDDADSAAEECEQSVNKPPDSAAVVDPRAKTSPGAALSDDDWSLPAIRILARTELVGCHADRGTVLDSDDTHCDEAMGLANGLEPAEATDRQKRELESKVLTEHGRIELLRGHSGEAVDLLEQATQRDPGNAGGYVALAAAYERQTTEQDDRDATVTVKKARDSCARAKELVGESHLQWAIAHKIEQELNGSEPARPRVSLDWASNSAGVHR